MITGLADAVSATDALNRQTGDSRYLVASTTLDTVNLPVANVSLDDYRLINVADA